LKCLRSYRHDTYVHLNIDGRSSSSAPRCWLVGGVIPQKPSPGCGPLETRSSEYDRQSPNPPIPQADRQSPNVWLWGARPNDPPNQFGLQSCSCACSLSCAIPDRAGRTACADLRLLARREASTRTRTRTSTIGEETEEDPPSRPRLIHRINSVFNRARARARYRARSPIAVGRKVYADLRLPARRKASTRTRTRTSTIGEKTEEDPPSRPRLIHRINSVFNRARARARYRARSPIAVGRKVYADLRLPARRKASTRTSTIGEEQRRIHRVDLDSIRSSIVLVRVLVIVLDPRSRRAERLTPIRRPETQIGVNPAIIEVVNSL
jgi:hypothetical protein